MNKEKLKYLTIGFILSALMFTTISTIASTRVVNRDVMYGVRVNLNGRPVQFAEDMQPFTMLGRTFLPVRGIGELFEGITVDWNASTQTVLLNTEPQITHREALLAEAVPSGQRRFDSRMGGNVAYFQTSVAMNDRTYGQSLLFRNLNSTSTLTLNSQFTTLTGTLGHVDSPVMARPLTLNFLGDNRIIKSIEMGAYDLPRQISVNVAGVNELAIQTIWNQASDQGWNRDDRNRRIALAEPTIR